MSSTLFGSLSEYLLPAEKTAWLGCPAEVMKVVLILRKLLGNTVAGIFYKTDYSYDSSDSCMSETTVSVHFKATEFPMRAEGLYEIGRFVHDSASDMEWASKEETDTPWLKDRTVHSHGALTSVNVQTLFGSTNARPLASLLALFQSAAASNQTELFVEKIGKAGSYRLRTRKWGEIKKVHLATLHVNETRGYYFTRYLGNLAIEPA